MKNKLLAIAIALALLTSTFSFAFVINPRANAGSLLHLDVFTSPSFLQNNYVTINGTGDWPEGSTVHLQAPAIVYVGSDTRYRFYWWVIDNTTTNGNYEFDLKMDTNHNVTAVYDYPGYSPQYLVTVNVPSDPNWIQNFTAHLWVGGDNNNGSPSYSMWITNGTFVQPGCESPNPYWPVDTVYVLGRHTNELAIFVNWTDYGYYASPFPGPRYIDWANPVQICSPMTFSPDWKYMYYIYASDQYTNGHVDIRPEQGWYSYGDILKINATKYTYITGTDRWRFNYWKVDGSVVSGPAGFILAVSGENITIQVFTNHTVEAWYWHQYKVEFDDFYQYLGLTGWSCVSTQTGWYDEYSVHTFTAPQYTNTTSDSRYRFLYWQNVTLGGIFGNLTNRDFSLNVTQSMHFTAVYLKQWLVQVFTSPADTGLLGKTFLTGGIMITDSSGWFDDSAWGSTPYTTAYFGAPKSYGYTEWSNGTGLNFTEWQYDAGNHWSCDNNTSWYVWRAINFTAVYQKYYRVTLSAVFDSNPIPDAGDFSWQGDWWYPEDAGTWIYPYTAPAMYVDPAAWVWLFDYWEISPYGNLASGRDLRVYMNTSYTAVAHYRIATGLVVDSRFNMFETAGNAYCHTFKVTIYATNVKELYSVKAKLTYDPKYLEIVGIDPTPLTSLGWFVADWDWVNDGSYELVASAIGNDTNGLTGGAIKLVVITFHIIYEPCVPPDQAVPLNLDISGGGLFHKNMTGITIDYLLGSTYYLKVLMPELMGYATFTNAGKSVVIDVYAVNVTKLHDYRFKLFYNTAELSLKSYEVITTFFPGPGLYTVSTGLGPDWFSITVTETSGYLANGTGPIVRLVFDVIVPGSAVSAVKFDATYSRISEKCDEGIIYLWKPWNSPGGPSNYNFLSLDDMYMPPPLPGDANLDGVVDIFDLRLVAYYMDKSTKNAGGPAPPSCDVYGNNNFVNIYDLIWVARNFGRHL